MEQPDWPIEHINDRKGQTTREKINASKAKKLLHWQAKVSLEQGIKKTLQWMSENNLTIIS